MIGSNTRYLLKSSLLYILNSTTWYVKIAKLRAIKNTKSYFWHILIYILKKSNPLLQRVCISDILTAKKEQNNSSSSNSIACTASNNRIMGFKKIRALFVEVLPIKTGRIYEQSVFYSSEWSTHFFRLHIICQFQGSLKKVNSVFWNCGLFVKSCLF